MYNELIDINSIPVGNIVDVNRIRYIINNIHCYCGMWIYDKYQMSSWSNSEYFDIFPTTDKREIYNLIFRFGMHFPGFQNCKITVIPLIRNGILLNNDCKIRKLNTNKRGLSFHKILL